MQLRSYILLHPPPLPPYLNALFIPDSSDDLDANLTDLGEVWLHHTDVLQDLDNTLAHTHTCVLENKTSHTKPSQ